MIRYTIRRVTVEEAEVLAETEKSAMREAFGFEEGHEAYYFERLALRVPETHVEVVRREPPPACRINDGGPCERPVVAIHRELKERVCEEHRKTMIGGHESSTTLTPVAPAEIPF